MILQLKMYLLIALMFGIVYGIVMAVSAYMGISSMIFYLFLTFGIIGFQYMIGPKLVEMAMKVKYITKEEEPELYQMVEDLAKKAKIKTPRVGIAHINIPNAFAFGRTKNNSRVCVTKRILEILDKHELKAVMGHEISHIKKTSEC